MTSYSVYVQAEGLVDEDQLDRLMDELEALDGVVSGGPGYPTWSATISVDEDTPEKAERRAKLKVAGAALRARILTSAITGAEATPHSEIQV